MTILTGWPTLKKHVPINIRGFWNYCDELAVHNGVLFKDTRVIIPRITRPEVMSRIHASHLGVFWPSVNAEVRDQIHQNLVTNSHKPAVPKSP